MSDQALQEVWRDARRHGRSVVDALVAGFAELDEEERKQFLRETIGTVYIGTSGEYSDYGINAVFLEKDRAERWRKRADENCERDYYDIEEHELFSEGGAEPGAFYVTILVSGEVLIEPQFDADDFPDTPATANDYPAYESVGGPRSRVIRFTGYGKTVEHARRSAEQARREWIIQNDWKAEVAT